MEVVKKQAFAVIEGKSTLEIDGQRITLIEGDVLSVSFTIVMSKYLKHFITVEDVDAHIKHPFEHAGT
jgi:uncharacterized cupin superfamily protein